MKICAKCGQGEPEARFHARASRCVSCVREYDRERYAANIEVGRARRRDYYRRNAEAGRARARRAYQADPRAQYERNKRQKKEDPDTWRGYQEKWRLTHPDVKQAEKQRRRALLRVAPGNGVSAKEWRDIKAASLGRCVYCGEAKRLTMDHVQPVVRGGAHSPDNVVGACSSCNSSKQDTPLLVWLLRRAA